MEQSTRRYRAAAAAYFVYGLLYLAGAIYLGQVGASPRALRADSIWWYLLGGAMVVVLPLLIWKQFKWVTRGLALLVFLRVMGLARLFLSPGWDMVPLPWEGQISEAYGAGVFLVVSLGTCWLLVHAGWSTWIARRRAGT